MIDQAIAHITEQMMAEGEDPLAIFIEEHLTRICINTEVAEKLLAPEKSVKKCAAMLWDEAKNRRKNNAAYIPDDEMHGLIDSYYGIRQGAAVHASKDKSGTIDIRDFL